ncbi:hypothetical protein ASZ90_014945 [hydrocarbon metagenome]|uniref:Uncharacterized protein n=1 Tax=hydrocarbon metagenome TaxID=938273 RepID=A0A0W8F3F5_9ZZZZ
MNCPDNPAIDCQIPLADVPGRKNPVAIYFGMPGFSIFDIPEEIGDDVCRIPGPGDLPLLEQQCRSCHVFNDTGKMRGDHHPHAIVTDCFTEHGMDEPGRAGVEGPGRLIGKKDHGFTGELPGKHNPLLLSPGKVPGDVHHAVGELHPVKEVRGPRNSPFLGIAGIIERMEYILDDPVISIEGKCPLEHDRSPADGPFPQTRFHPVPEIDIDPVHDGPTGRTGIPCHGGQRYLRAMGTGSEVVEYRPCRRRRIDPPQEVHQNCLTTATPPDDAENFSLPELKGNVVQDQFPVIFHRKVLDAYYRLFLYHILCLLMPFTRYCPVLLHRPSQSRIPLQSRGYPPLTGVMPVRVQRRCLKSGTIYPVLMMVQHAVYTYTYEYNYLKIIDPSLQGLAVIRHFCGPGSLLPLPGTHPSL